MCRWGCETVDTTYMCKWCGTRYCKECLRGDFSGLMTEPTKCRKCNQVRCQGTRVDYVVPPKSSPLVKGGSKTIVRGRPAARSASPSKKTAAGRTAKVKKAKGSKKKKRK